MDESIPLCQVGRSHLLLIDLQSRLLSAMPSIEREHVLSNTRILLQAANLLEIPVLLSEQYPRGLGHTEESVIGSLPPQNTTVEKTSFSCCGEPGYLQHLQNENRQQVVIAGVEAHICVLQTAIELTKKGKQVFVVEDAVCSRNPANKQNALARLRQAGVIITNIESVLFEWLGDATHPQFKALSALIR